MNPQWLWRTTSPGAGAPDQNRMNQLTSQWSDLASRVRALMEACAGGSRLSSDRTSDSDSFNELALAVFRLQFEHVPAYQRLCTHRRLSPDKIMRWEDIPAVPTAAFKELDLTSLAPAERTAVFHSSGTTAQKPSRHFHNAASLALYEASVLPWFGRHLLGDGSSLTILSLTPPAAQAPHSSLVHMFETVCRRYGAPDSGFVGKAEADGAWSINAEALGRAAGLAGEARHPVLLLGTAFNFVQLLDGLDLCVETCSLPTGSRIMETGGYKGRTREIPKADLHAGLVERLGVLPAHIVSEYGMSELSSQAYDHAIAGERTEERAGNPISPKIFSSRPIPPRVFHFPPWVRVQILSPETGREVADGETGLIRVFDLANLRSVMALQTEDLGVRRGDGFELLGRSGTAEPRGCSFMSREGPGR